MISRLTVRAFAKVNLALSVGPPGAAGLHPIASWMAPINLFDELEIERASARDASEHRVRWATDPAPAHPSPIDWPVEQDLAVRAHRLLEEHARRALPVSLLVRKRIPVGGGLGGGSADAAAMLRGVNAMFNLNLGGDELRAIGARLGSDVPFFLDETSTDDGPPRPALVGGRGEAVRRIGRTPATIVLIVPPFGCPTGAVYGAFDRLGAGVLRERRVQEVALRAVQSGRLEATGLFNDLAPAAESVTPRLAQVRTLAGLLVGPGRPVHLSGSGSTLFVVAGAGGPDAEDMAHRLRDDRLDAAVIVTHLA